MKIREEIQKMSQMCQELRRLFHQIPEIEFETKQTWQKIKEIIPLEADELVKNGGCYFIQGKQDTCIAFRCELDGLSIEEKNDVDYRSTNHCMHACGHDGHIAAQIVLLKYLLAHQKQLNQSILFIFQPSEESGSGAKSFIEHHLFEKYQIEKIIAAHVMPTIASSKIACCKSKIMAQSCEFEITIQGKSSHAATYWLGKDAIQAMVMFCNLIHLNTKEPSKRFLLHIGKINGGEIVNGVASYCQCLGTIRSLDEKMFIQIKKELQQICTSINQLGFICQIKYKSEYLAVINQNQLVCDLQNVCHESYIEIPPFLLSEDFSFYGQRVPSLFYFCGIDTETMLHANNFDFNEEHLLKIIEVNLRLLEYWHIFI